jgi:hypothetical protein
MSLISIDTRTYAAVHVCPDPKTVIGAILVGIIGIYKFIDCTIIYLKAIVASMGDDTTLRGLSCT